MRFFFETSKDLRLKWKRPFKFEYVKKVGCARIRNIVLIHGREQSRLVSHILPDSVGELEIDRAQVDFSMQIQIQPKISM